MQSVMTIVRLTEKDIGRLVILLKACAIWCLVHVAYAAYAAHPQHQVDVPSDWASASSKVSLTSHLKYFKETLGETLDWQQARDSTRWRTSDAEGMAALHGHTSMWLQLLATNSGTKPITRLVALDSWLLQDVELWVLDADGRRLLEHQRSGQALAPEMRAVNAEVPTFAVTIGPGQQVQLLLRMSARYWSNVQLDAWESVAFTQAQMLPKLGFAVVSGVALALCVVLILLGGKLLVFTSVWVLLSLLLELAFAGLLAEFLLPAREFPPELVMLGVGWLTSCASAFVTMYFMGLAQHRFWYRWNWCMLAISLLLILLAQDSPSYVARQAMTLFTIIQVLSNMAMLASAKLSGHPWRQWMAGLMVVNFVFAVGRVVLFQFYVEPDTYDYLMTSILTIKGIRVLMVIGLVALQRNSEVIEVRQRLQETELQQRQLLQAAVERRTSELHQALIVANQANSAKTDFLARVSHDLRSPLTSITGYAQLLQRMGGRTGQLAQTIRHSAEHMKAMVNDLIDFARGDLGEQAVIRPVYIHRLLDGVASQAMELAQRQGNRFIMTLKTELPPVVLVDAKRLQQILMNLLENAAKFTHQGQVELVVESTAQDDGQLLLQLRVADTGAGISVGDQERIFEPFFRGDSAEAVKGTGLGLSIVQTWVRRLGGAVTVQSALNQGTTFMLTLPITVGSESDMAPRQRLDDVVYLPTLDGEGRLAWVVEDNAPIRELLAEELRTTGFEVLTATDGTDFIKRIGLPGARLPSVVLTDYVMPGADGAAVLRAVRAHWPGVPVVLLSATQKTMQSLGVARDEGFDASLMKPLNLADLRVTLAEVLDLPTPRDGEISRPIGLTESNDENDSDAAIATWVGDLRLTVDELEHVKLWVDMGALTDLTEWAEALARRHPEHASFAARVLTLLSMARLDEVLELCEAARINGSQND